MKSTQLLLAMITMIRTFALVVRCSKLWPYACIPYGCTNRVKEVCVHFAYFSRIKNSFFTSLLHISIIIQSINKMFFKFVTNRRKLIFEIRVFILTFREKNKSYDKIIDQLKFARSIVIITVHRIKKQFNVFFVIKKRMNRFFKLNNREKRTFIRHIDKNSYDNLIVFVIFFKLDHQLFKFIVRKYMKNADFLRFKIKKKFYLTIRHKIAKLI